MSTSNAIYQGKIRHRRKAPKHEFTYGLYMFYLNIDEIETIFEDRKHWGFEKRGLISFCRSDYHGHPGVPLKTAVKYTVNEKLGFLPTGSVTMLTQLRFLGYVFNPVSFYYCFDSSGENLQAILAEIQNTPWKEKHSYALDMRLPESEPKLRARCFNFNKEFHISPFMAMDVKHRWFMKPPENYLSIHMDNIKQGKKVFDATLVMGKRPLPQGSFSVLFLAYPLMTLKITLGIYFQALRLWLKRARFYSHPQKIAKKFENLTEVNLRQGV